MYVSIKLFSSIFIQEILESIFFIIKTATTCSQESLYKLNGKLKKNNSSKFYFELCTSNILENICLLMCFLEQVYNEVLKHYWNFRKPQNITCLKRNSQKNNNINQSKILKTPSPVAFRIFLSTYCIWKCHNNAWEYSSNGKCLIPSLHIYWNWG